MLLSATSTTLALLNSYTSLSYPSSLIPVDTTIRDNAMRGNIILALGDILAQSSGAGEGGGTLALTEDLFDYQASRACAVVLYQIRQLSLPTRKLFHAFLSFLPTKSASYAPFFGGRARARTLVRNKCVQRRRVFHPNAGRPCLTARLRRSAGTPAKTISEVRHCRLSDVKIPSASKKIQKSEAVKIIMKIEYTT